MLLWRRGHGRGNTQSLVRIRLSLGVYFFGPFFLDWARLRVVWLVVLWLRCRRVTARLLAVHASSRQGRVPGRGLDVLFWWAGRAAGVGGQAKSRGRGSTRPGEGRQEGRRAGRQEGRKARRQVRPPPQLRLQSCAPPPPSEPHFASSTPTRQPVSQSASQHQ